MRRLTSVLIEEQGPIPLFLFRHQGMSHREAVASEASDEELSDEEKACSTRRDDAASSCQKYCHLCCQPVERAYTKSLHGFWFHPGDCWNGVRCFRRLHGPKELKALDREMAENPDKWRHKAAPCASKGRSRASARREVKQQIETQSYRKTESDKPVLSLTKRRYKSYKKMWDQMSSTEASDEFSAEHERQGGEADSGSEERILVHDNPVKHYVEGDSTIKKSIRPSEKEGHRARRGRSQQRDDHQRHRRRHRTRESVRRGETRDHKHGRSMVSIKENSLGTDADSDSLSSAHAPSAACSTPMTGRKREPEPSVARSSREPQKNDPANGMMPEEDTDIDVNKKVVKKRCRSKTAVEGKEFAPPAKVAKKLSPREVMEQASCLQQRCTKSVTKLQGKGSILGKLRSGVGKLEQPQLASLEKDPQVVIKALEDMKNQLQELAQNCEGTKASELEAKKEGVDAAMTTYDGLVTEAEELLDALKYVISKQAKVAKGSRNQERYFRSKIQQRLVAGGWGPVLSKTVVPMLQAGHSEQISVNPGTFKPASVSLWQSDSDIKTAVKNFVTEAAESIQNKANALKEAMNANEKWGGSLGRISGDVEKIVKSIDTPAELTKEPGAGMWITCLRAWSWRYGPNASPLPGVGSLVTTYGSGDIKLLCCPVLPMLEQGIVLKEGGKFLETDSGQEFVSTHAEVISVCEGEVAWIPYGYIAVTLLVGPELKAPVPEEKDEQETGEDKEPSEPYGFLLSIPVFSVEMAKDLESQAWSAITSWNGGHLDKHKDAKLWKPRRECWHEFLKLITDNTSQP